MDRARYTVTIPMLPDVFDYRFGSCFVRMRKPDLELYKYVLNAMDFEPEEVVFIDDRIENVYCANMVGMHAFKFNGAKKLKEIIETYSKK